MWGFLLNDACAIVTTMLVCMPVYRFYCKRVLPYVECRPTNVCIHDSVLEMLPTVDTSLAVTALSCTSIAILLSQYTTQTCLMYQISMAIHFAIRSVLIFFCPLKVHKDHIVLRDTVVETLVRQFSSKRSRKPFVNDLFISGHLSHALIIMHLTPVWFNTNVMVSSTLALCLLLSKSHYTVDLLLPPFIIPFVVLWSGQIVQKSVFHANWKFLF
jgi:hypothetical protein